MTYRTVSYLFSAIVFLFIPLRLEAISINVTGSWSLNIDSADVISGAGGDLTSQYVSNANEINVDISAAVDDADTWQIQVHKVDTLWHGDLTLSLLRTSDGAGTGSISGGNSLFLDLTAADQNFFDGAGNRSTIDIQLKLSGVSVLVPSDSYSTTVYYTVIDTP